MNGVRDIIEARPNLYLIRLEQEIKGFENCIGSWLFDGKYKFLVDVGPKASVGRLIERLKILNIQKLDFIFLTHVHIDHAGATGALIRCYPEAKVICHPSGVKHLIDPRKLWEGSKEVLGEVALKYGEIDPVSRGNIVPFGEFNLEGFQLVETPGHAPHHISLVYKGYLFAGEAGGVFSDREGKVYLRPATPPKFILEETIRSIDRLLELEGKEICYAHFGIHHNVKEMLRRHRNQLFLWRDVIAEEMKNSKERENLVGRCINSLCEKDELFKAFKDIRGDEKDKELYFTQISIEGFVRYLNAPY